MTKKPPPPPRPSRITIPDHCHPLAKVVFAEMRRQGMTYDELEYRSGVLRSTFKAWRHRTTPGLSSIEAALVSLGWAVIPVPRVEHLPAEVQAGLEALAEQWQRADPLLNQLLATVSAIPIIGEMKRAETAAVVPMRRRKARALHPQQLLLIEDEAPTEQAA